MQKEDKDIAVHVAYEEFEQFDPAEPERNLLRAIILGALNDLKKQGDPSRRATEFFLNNDENYIFSFRTICNFLEVDAERILVTTGLKRSKLVD